MTHHYFIYLINNARMWLYLSISVCMQSQTPPKLNGVQTPNVGKRDDSTVPNHRALLRSLTKWSCVYSLCDTKSRMWSVPCYLIYVHVICQFNPRHSIRGPDNSVFATFPRDYGISYLILDIYFFIWRLFSLLLTARISVTNRHFVDKC
jgi:hypothetical protein